jgi:hypothetical protein
MLAGALIPGIVEVMPGDTSRSVGPDQHVQRPSMIATPPDTVSSKRSSIQAGYTDYTKPTHFYEPVHGQSFRTHSGYRAPLVQTNDQVGTTHPYVKQEAKAESSPVAEREPKRLRVGDDNQRPGFNEYLRQAFEKPMYSKGPFA